MFRRLITVIVAVAIGASATVGTVQDAAAQNPSPFNAYLKPSGWCDYCHLAFSESGCNCRIAPPIIFY